ncbi:MAG: response regulator [Rhodocyclaceae bacterium]|jgi:signal transduction histidine kinase|nr:response regulator [Rhodocyclaceae bacterium]MCA3017322.1 response regulator [Rhodocyclaceae bacterium]MCA3020666.1 response regulator [Rhodocyclaceae bacterium]MCA3026647.1 response regulator [Rhodocyclaceae bacterium]MCA3029540.1 response regulator [Rhodocyclaceae bacterium]
MTDSSSKSFRILFVEDSELDYELIVLGLINAGLALDARRVETELMLIDALTSERWDLVVSDHQLPQLSAECALAIVKQFSEDLPFIIVSGQMGEDLAVESMRNGADDYLVKGRLKRLPVAIERSIEAAKTRAARNLAQQNLLSSERRLRAFAMHLSDVRERDRAAIRTEVHDEIGGNLLAAKFALTRLERMIATSPLVEPQLKQLDAEIHEAAELVQKAVDASQKLYTSLRSNLLDQGIVAAIEWRLTQLQKRSGIVAHLSASPREFALPDNIALAAYHAVGELIENVEMHSKAQYVRCAVFYIDGGLTIVISDDGVGCTLEQIMNPSRFGIFSARERISSVGGTLEFDTTYTGLETGTVAMVIIDNVGQMHAGESAT